MNYLWVHLVKKPLPCFPYFPREQREAYVPDDFGKRSTACSAHSAQLSLLQASFFSVSVCTEHTFLLLCLQSGLPWKEDLESELCQILSGQICPLLGVTVLCSGTQCSSPAFIGNKATNACCSWPPLDTQRLAWSVSEVRTFWRQAA